MALEKKGVLPIQDLRSVFEAGCIKGVEEKYLNPASIDLPLLDEAYRLESIFLNRGGRKVRDMLRFVGAVPHDLKLPLEVGVPYLVRIAGEYELPKNVYGYANPKSSVGRINLFCRVMADWVAMYDALTGPGWSGEIWVLIRADSFPVLLAPGQPVSQLRLFDGKNFLDELELELAIKKHGLLYRPGGRRMRRDRIEQHADSFFLTLRVGDSEATGWECRGLNKVLDYGRVGHYRPEDFFTRVEVEEGALILRKGSFYILSTDEHVVVPPHLSAELRAMDPRFGEFRSHAAGYIDPGWGWGKHGEEHGRPITLEVTPHETTKVFHGQNIARLRYEHMRSAPETVYDAASSNYTVQEGPKLSKHFIPSSRSS